MKKNAFYRFAVSGGPAIVFAALIWFLSSLPHVGVDIGEILGLDKVAHFLEYAVFGLLLHRWFAAAGGGHMGLRALAVAAAVAAAYGLTDEWHQSFVPGRDASLWDALFDALGGAFGATVHNWLRRRALKR